MTKFVVSGGRFVLMGKYGCLRIQISINYNKAEDCYRKYYDQSAQHFYLASLH